MPELVITPDFPYMVTKVEAFYALNNPCSFARAWRDTPSVRQGQHWIGKMPVLNVDDYVFGYANLTYDSSIVRSTRLETAIASKVGRAKATDTPSVGLPGSGYSAWRNIVELEGRKGIKGFRSTQNARGSATEQLHDPKWQAPAKALLSFKLYCTAPQTLVLTAADHNTVQLEITASNEGQEMSVVPGRLNNRFDHSPMADWSKVRRIHVPSKQGFDLARFTFADAKWVTPNTQNPEQYRCLP